ncbi:MAG: DUF2070 family protein [Euryarchaeota archaeon]|nr:DUF2070 family protein [Euryarchaeota archaeon]
MSSVKNVMSLTKYIVKLPETKFSLFSMIFVSFIVGCIVSLMEPNAKDSILYSIVYGGSTGFLIFGLTSIMSGGLTQPMVNALDGRRMKMKQSMFLAFASMIIVALVYIIGSIVSVFSVYNYNYTVDALIFGCAVVFAFRTVTIWGTSNISLIKSITIAGVQPALIISMVIVIVFLTSITTNIGYFNIIALLIKIIIASLILMIAIYSFVVVVEAPMRRNLGVGGLELLSLFIAHMTEGSSAMEGLFEDMGETIDTLVGILSFRDKKGIKALFITPCVHPGPIGNIGGGNMPTILSERFNVFTMVSHGPSTHDFNPVSSKEIYKIDKIVKEALDRMDYSENASKFVRVENKKAKIGAQYFNNNLIILATFSPHGFDDIDFGVGLAATNLARASFGIKNVILVDCHNCFKGEAGRILPGNKEVFELMGAIEKLEEIKEEDNIKIGCASDPLDDMGREEGVGQSGVKVMIVEVSSPKFDVQKTAYVLIDANNMVGGFRERIIKKVTDLGIDHAEVMTTDTHSVNTLAGGHNPVGYKKQDEILDSILKCIMEASDDMEQVSVAGDVCKIKGLKTLGPTHATELVTTISSIIAVSRIFAPLVFILALLFVFIWIFYWAF